MAVGGWGARPNRRKGRTEEKARSEPCSEPLPGAAPTNHRPFRRAHHRPEPSIAQSPGGASLPKNRSLFNHSCRGNVVTFHAGGSCFVRAIEDIAVGEEVSQSLHVQRNLRLPHYHRTCTLCTITYHNRNAPPWPYSPPPIAFESPDPPKPPKPYHPSTQLTVEYLAGLSLFQSAAARQHELGQRWGFRCGCRR